MDIMFSWKCTLCVQDMTEFGQGNELCSVQFELMFFNNVLTVGQRLQLMRGPPIAPPLPRPPPPPPMMLPPSLQVQGPQGVPQSMQHMGPAPQVRAEASRAAEPPQRCVYTDLFIFDTDSSHSGVSNSNNYLINLTSFSCQHHCKLVSTLVLLLSLDALFAYNTSLSAP